MGGDLKVETVRSAAERLGLQESTVRKWIYQGRVGVVRLGRSVRLRTDEVDDLIKNHYRAPILGDLRKP